MDLKTVSTRDPRAKQNGIEVGPARRGGHPCSEGRRLERPRSERGHRVISRTMQPGHWRQDPISKAPIAMGAEWSKMKPFVIQSATQFRAPPPPADELSGVCGRLRRSEGARRRRRAYAHATHRRSDRDGNLLGLRWHAEPVRSAAPLQPDPARDHQAQQQRRLARAPVRAGQHRDGRCEHRDLGIEVPLRFLAPGHRHP